MDTQRAIEILKENSENQNVRPIVREALRMAVDAMEWKPMATAPKDGSFILAKLAHGDPKKVRWASAEESADLRGGEPDDYFDVWEDEDGGDWADPRGWKPIESHNA